MRDKTTPKKPYTIILDTSEREEVVEFARNNTWKAALTKYGISIATLKRWSSIYNQPIQTLERKYGHQRRHEKYPVPCMLFRRFLYDHENNSNKHGFLTCNKAKVIKMAREYMKRKTSSSTIYRLFQYVEDRKDDFNQYLL